MADYEIPREGWDRHLWISGHGEFVVVDIADGQELTFYLEPDEVAQMVATLNATMAHIEGFEDKVLAFSQAIKALEED